MAKALDGENNNDKTAAVYALIKRVLPQHANKFVIGFIEKKNGNDCFEIESVGGKIMLRGNNGISIASALNYYLKNFAHCSITWNGNNLHLPNPLPVVKEKVQKESPYKYRYYLNYCTFNYTMSWWNWERWQKEVDWMALNGINMPLAITGQEAVWNKVYRSMGLSQDELKNFFSGPAYFSWFWMGNLDAWGGPLPQSWMKSHEELQKKILQSERELGMTPVLPAFTGHVPSALRNKFLTAKFKTTNWNGKFGDVYLLDPSDPLFITIGKKFIEEQTATFGTDHIYSADTFNENVPPTNDSTFLGDVSKKVYQSMAAADPKAVWVMQGWLFHFSAKFWQPTQIKALLNAVPNDKMILLDLWSEKNPVWTKTEAYYGKPWIWCMLHNFGGNNSLYGRMQNVAADPSAALHNSNKGKLIGLGLTPEAIEQNPVMYDLMLENVWHDEPIALNTWLNGYALRRYGKRNTDVEKAWQILKETAYNDSITNGGAESIVCGRPTFSASTRGVATRLSYRAAQLLPAWNYFMTATEELKSSEGFRYDVVDLTRQVLANYANALQQQCARLYKKGDLDSFQKQSDAFLALISDMDNLLATQKDFLLGKWLADARSWGTTAEEKNLYEKNARNLITLWGDKNSTLREYSCRQWSGLLNGFYKKRWEQFFAYVVQQMKSHQPVEEKYFDNQIKEWEWSWVNSHEAYPDETNGSSITVAKAMYRKYKDVVAAIYK
ncbi:alpha-N-acetylglucosaminidase [Flavisolibacter ginsenosidimutans]